MKPPLHSSGDASRLKGVAPRTAAVRGHNMSNMLRRRALSGRAPHRSRCYAGFHHGLLALGYP